MVSLTPLRRGRVIDMKRSAAARWAYDHRTSRNNAATKMTRKHSFALTIRSIVMETCIRKLVGIGVYHSSSVYQVSATQPDPKRLAIMLCYADARGSPPLSHLPPLICSERPSNFSYQETSSTPLSTPPFSPHPPHPWRPPYLPHETVPISPPSLH